MEPSSPRRFDVIAVGLDAVDVLVRLPDQVTPDAKHLVRELMIQGGAPVGTGSAAVSMLGYATAFVGRLGRNTVSEIAIDQFHTYGVSTELIVRDEASRPALALVEIDPRTAARTVFVNLDDYGFLRQQDIPVEAIRAARVLMVDSYDLDASEWALRAAQGSACRTLLDFESGDTERMRRLLSLGTDIVLPLGCGRQLSGETEPERVLAALAGLTKGQLVVTDGERGSWGWTGAGAIHEPALAVADKVDSTGCGDAFHAGYAVGLIEDWPLKRRMEFGTLLASRVIRKVGGRTALPRRADLGELASAAQSAALAHSMRELARTPTAIHAPSRAISAEIAGGKTPTVGAVD
jgi:sulfofructose kinase